ncbi:MAG TPA: C25 family cysteine peptidase, partial [Planctomycetota bacterium]|nr:C25 family cysteine peptidase [Planctomycetota bacterium]
AGNFPVEADSIIAANPSITWTRNYLGVTSQDAVSVNEAMTQAANGGASVLLYNGHGSAARLGAAAPRILDTDTVQAWNGNVVFIAATCTFNWVAKDENGYHSIPIQAMVQPQGGMAASIATTTYMESAPAVEFTKQLLSQSQSLGAKARWGDVLLRAQQWAYSQSSAPANGSWYLDLSKTESILGDPAMPVYSKTSAPVQSTNVPGAF